jgi:hypothetical protein
MFTLTLNYADGTSWFAGGFESMDALNAWLSAEQSRPYWKPDTTTTIVDMNVIIE